MERYQPSVTRYGLMLPAEKGNYVEYEHVLDIVEVLLDECGQNETSAEDFIKEWE